MDFRERRFRMRRKKHFLTVVCLVIGVIVLTTAAVANFENANGYTAYKDALKNMLYIDNFTGNLTMEILYNGEVRYASSNQYMLANGAQVEEYSANSESEGSRQYSNQSWTVKNPNPVNQDRGYLDYSLNNNVWNINASTGSGWLSNIDRKDSMAKTLRFVELLADTFVGDLKNNFVLTSESDGVKTYQIVLSGSQLPEYVSAGISMLYSTEKYQENGIVVYANDLKVKGEPYDKAQTDAWALLEKNQYKGVVFVQADGTLQYFATSDLYYNSDYAELELDSMESIFRTMSTEPTIESAKCFLTLDPNGRLLSNTLEGTVLITDRKGNINTMTVRIHADLSDYGTTVIEMPVITDNDTVYDYSQSSETNQYSYTVTENGVVSTFSSEKVKEEYTTTEAEPAPVYQ